jgi:hypothetical protein
VRLEAQTNDVSRVLAIGLTQVGFDSFANTFEIIAALVLRFCVVMANDKERSSSAIEERPGSGTNCRYDAG